MRRPKALTVGDLHARVIRGPRDDGRHYWQARRYQDGKETAVWSGWGTREETARELAARVAGGPKPSRSGAKAQTLSDLLSYWLGAQEDRQDLQPSSVRIYTLQVQQLDRVIGAVQLARATGRTAAHHRDSRLREGGATRTVRDELKTLAAAWRWGVEVGLCQGAAPAAEVIVKPTNNHYTPSPGEVAIVLRHLQGEGPEWVARWVRLAWATGARRAEIGGLLWSNLNVARRTLTVQGKTGERVIPISADLVRELESWTRQGATLIGVRPSLVSRLPTLLGEVCGACEVPVFSPHGLRRAAVDRLARSGVDPATAAALLGHSPEVMLRHYRRVTPEDLAGAAERLDSPLPAGQAIPLRRKE